MFKKTNHFKFLLPSDSKILKDINNTENSIQFIGLGSVCQNIKKAVFIRMIKFNNEDDVKKVVYKKNLFSWGFSNVEIENF